VRGWVNYYSHANSGKAFRALQLFIKVRFRRYLTHRSKGRGFGWKKYPDGALYARGLIHIGRWVHRGEGAAVQAL
jgi:RNA-directed DNA polymerase